MKTPVTSTIDSNEEKVQVTGGNLESNRQKGPATQSSDCPDLTPPRNRLFRNVHLAAEVMAGEDTAAMQLV